MRKIISLILVLASLLSVVSVMSSAAKAEEFISEVALVYEDSIKKAKEKIAGTDWKLFEYDLNANADAVIDDGVYLIYKTTTNVEEAITDLRVMDMYGGFSVANYERELKNSRDKYLAMGKAIRAAAEEFKALYNAGDAMAALAYRQMNYYKDIGGTGMLMGDFLLNIPSDDALVTVMMEGNMYIVTNLVNLLAVGISGEDDNTLSAKMIEAYMNKDTLTDKEYYDLTLPISNALQKVRTKLLRHDSLVNEYVIDDENMTDEEYTFVAEFAALAVLMDEIQLGESTLVDFVRKGDWEISDLYPLTAALTKGQLALVDLGQFETVLKYNSPSKPIEELNAMLDETEKDLTDSSGNIKPIDVYLGVDRSIFKGAYAITTAAERQQALTGETWNASMAREDSMPFYIASYALLGLDVVIAGVEIGIAIKSHLLASTAKAMAANIAYEGPTAVAAAKFKATLFNDKWFPVAKMLGVAAVAILLIAAGMVTISTLYNYYNPDYTEIPNVMVDVKETDLGDRYVKYTAAKVYDGDGKNADFNAYEGKEWIALYYTKDASAGNCLTPNLSFSNNNSAIARRHQGISMFGETKAYNLNSHVYSANAKGAYVTIRYSNTKKAAADVPVVVGSMFSDGAIYALCSFGGLFVGVGSTLAVGAIKRKRKAAKEAEELI